MKAIGVSPLKAGTSKKSNDFLCASLTSKVRRRVYVYFVFSRRVREAVWRRGSPNDRLKLAQWPPRKPDDLTYKRSRRGKTDKLGHCLAGGLSRVQDIPSSGGSEGAIPTIGSIRQ